MPLIDSFAPPTTSLYQFMALSGLVVFMFFKYLRHSSRKVFRTKFREIELISTVLTRKIQEAKEKLKEQGKVQQVLNQEADEKMKLHSSPELKMTEEGLKELRAFLKKQEAFLAEQYEMIAEIALLELEQDKQSVVLGELEDAKSDYEESISYDITISVISLIVAGAGFAFWYFKIQQYQDLILLHQAIKG